MEEFDVIYFGTSIQDLIAVRSYSNSKVLVIDTKETFGDSTMQDNCTIDKLPVLMRKNDALINALVEMNIHLFIDFVNIKNHLYFYNDQNTMQFYELPTSKSELAQCQFISNKDKCLINKFVTSGIFDAQKLDKSTINIFRKCILTNNDDLSPLIRYLESFNNYHLLFPIHGYKEICENIVRCNAINGITYLLDSTIDIKTFDDETIVKSKYGDFVTKRFVDNRSNKAQKQYVKVICYNKELYAPLFYGVFDLTKQIHCLCLNDKANVCPENNYLMYIWIKNDIVTDEDLVSMGIDLDSVVSTFGYYTDEFDYDYYKWQ